MTAKSAWLLIAGLLFALFVLSKLLPWPRSSAQRASYQRLGELKLRARDHALSPAERAAALREAATLALEELSRPGLAAGFARRAERLQPEDVEAVGLIAKSLRKQARYVALERLLWRMLAEHENDDPARRRVGQELVQLYDGPLKRPEIASVLRRLHVG